VEALVDAYRREHGAAVLWVSHDPEQRRRVAARRFLIRDRRLVGFPLQDALLVGAFTAVLVVGTSVLLGTGVAAFLTFAGAYALATGVVWGRRVRRGEFTED